MLPVHVRRHHMAELIAMIKVWQLEINLLALNVLSRLESMFIDFCEGESFDLHLVPAAYINNYATEANKIGSRNNKQTWQAK